MIHLKDKLNKTATLKQLREYAEKGYKDSWQPELQVEAFMKGAETLLNLLHLPRVSGSYYYLKKGDEIKTGDEYQEQDGDLSWRKTGQIGKKYNPSTHYKHRRLQ